MRPGAHLIYYAALFRGGGVKRGPEREGMSQLVRRLVLAHSEWLCYMYTGTNVFDAIIRRRRCHTHAASRSHHTNHTYVCIATFIFIEISFIAALLIDLPAYYYVARDHVGSPILCV